jgi:hypothetical protein
MRVKGFKRHCISDEMDGREREARNVGSKHESVSSECKEEDGKCKETQTAANNRNCELTMLDEN